MSVSGKKPLLIITAAIMPADKYKLNSGGMRYFSARLEGLKGVVYFGGTRIRR